MLFKHHIVPVKSNVKTCIFPIWDCLLCLKEQRAVLAGGEEQIDWCIGELKLPRLVISPASVWKLCEHRDASHRRLAVPGCSHITAACHTTRLTHSLMFTSPQLLRRCKQEQIYGATLCLGTKEELRAWHEPSFIWIALRRQMLGLSFETELRQNNAADKIRRNSKGSFTRQLFQRNMLRDGF